MREVVFPSFLEKEDGDNTDHENAGKAPLRPATKPPKNPTRLDASGYCRLCA
jgi:hypothetical protein